MPGTWSGRRRLPLWAAGSALCLLAAACGSAGGTATTGSLAPTSTAAATTAAITTTTAPPSPATTMPTTTVPATTPTTTTLPTTTTTRPPWWREVSVDAPLKIWVIGDSLTPLVGAALQALGEGTGLAEVTVEAHEGTGLIHTETLDWSALVAAGAPAGSLDAVVVLLGTNDGQGLYTAEGWADAGTPEWEAAYGELVGSLMDQLLGLGRRVYWVGQPVMGGVNFDRLMRRVTAVVREEAAERLGARLIDAYRLFQGDDGGFASELPDETGNPVTVRSTDGIHYTAGGGRRLAGTIWEILAADWDLPGG